jgi:cell division protein FtsN
VSDQKAARNVIEGTTPQDMSKTQPDTGTKTGVPPIAGQQTGPPPQKIEEKKQVQTPPPVQQQVEEPRIEGITTNSMGWTDEKYKVVYVKLDNGKIAIQESSWDSDAKANSRIAQINTHKIAGLNSSLAKVDVGGKSWFRVRLGEFSTLQEARSKAVELRNKVK